VTFDRAGRYVAALLGSADHVPSGLPQGVGLKIWELSSGREVLSLPASDRAIAFDFSPDGTQVAVVLRNGELVVRRTASGETRKTISASPGPVAFNDSGRLLAFGGRSIRILDTESLRIVAQVEAMEGTRRIQVRSADLVLAVESFPPGNRRGVTQLLRWKPDDIRADACRVMPKAAAARQWQQLYPESPPPAPCDP
jgi:hypothetical protein